MATQFDGGFRAQICALRFGRLNAAGQVPAGPTNSYVTSAVGKLEVKPSLEAGVEILFKDGCGGLAATYKARDIPKRFDVTLDLLKPDPEIDELLTQAAIIQAPANFGQRTLTDGQTTNTSPTFTSGQANFTVADVGGTLTGTGIPVGSTISALINPVGGVSSQVQMSQNATATGSALSVTVQRALPANFSGALPAPNLVTLTTSTSGGTLAAGPFFYKITATLAGNETTPSNELTVTTTGATSSNTLTWTAVPNATGYNIYRSATTGTELKLASVLAVTTYIDTAPGSPSGALPVINTTTLVQTVGAYSQTLGVFPTDYGISVEAWAKVIVGSNQARTLPWMRYGLFCTYWSAANHVLDNSAQMTTYTGWAVENLGFGTGPGRDWLGGATGVTPSRAVGRYRDFAIPPITDPGYTPVVGTPT